MKSEVFLHKLQLQQISARKSYVFTNRVQEDIFRA
jgi:hypothetical protein